MKKINWRDFEIADLQPNLIPDGWDSFEPYGSGKNYLKNWDFSTEDAWLEHRTKFSYVDGKVVIDFDDNWGGIRQVVGGEEEKVFVLRARVRVTGSEPAIMRFQWGGTQSNLFEVSPDQKWVTIEAEMNGMEPSTLYVYKARASTNIVEIDWVQFTPIDDQHLVVEKTPLGNGLTRIQTWGGKYEFKLMSRSSDGWKENTTYTFSCFVSSEHNVGFRLFNQRQGLIWSKDFGEYMKHTMTLNRNLSGLTHIQTENINDNLDFIASDPQIVEGDKANPVLLIHELEDGRERVQVHGVKNDTKLISPKIEGLSGEPYQIKADIENNGIEMSMDSTLGDKSISVGKGENSVSHTGELQGQHIIIELGAKDE